MDLIRALKHLAAVLGTTVILFTGTQPQSEDYKSGLAIDKCRANLYNGHYSTLALFE